MYKKERAQEKQKVIRSKKSGLRIEIPQTSNDDDFRRTPPLGFLGTPRTTQIPALKRSSSIRHGHLVDSGSSVEQGSPVRQSISPPQGFLTKRRASSSGEETPRNHLRPKYKSAASVGTLITPPPYVVDLPSLSCSLEHKLESPYRPVQKADFPFLASFCTTDDLSRELFGDNSVEGCSTLSEAELITLYSYENALCMDASSLIVFLTLCARNKNEAVSEKNAVIYALGMLFCFVKPLVDLCSIDPSLLTIFITDLNSCCSKGATDKLNEKLQDFFTLVKEKSPIESKKKCEELCSDLTNRKNAYIEKLIEMDLSTKSIEELLHKYEEIATSNCEDNVEPKHLTHVPKADTYTLNKMKAIDNEFKDVINQCIESLQKEEIKAPNEFRKMYIHSLKKHKKLLAILDLNSPSLLVTEEFLKKTGLKPGASSHVILKKIEHRLNKIKSEQINEIKDDMLYRLAKRCSEQGICPEEEIYKTEIMRIKEIIENLLAFLSPSSFSTLFFAPSSPSFSYFPAKKVSCTPKIG